MKNISVRACHVEITNNVQIQFFFLLFHVKVTSYYTVLDSSLKIPGYFGWFSRTKHVRPLSLNIVQLFDTRCQHRKFSLAHISYLYYYQKLMDSIYCPLIPFKWWRTLFCFCYFKYFTQLNFLNRFFRIKVNLSIIGKIKLLNSGIWTRI